MDLITVFRIEEAYHPLVLYTIVNTSQNHKTTMLPLGSSTLLLHLNLEIGILESGFFLGGGGAIVEVTGQLVQRHFLKVKLGGHFFGERKREVIVWKHFKAAKDKKTFVFLFFKRAPG